MVLENVPGNLLACKKLVRGTFQHSDQLTTERRTNHQLRCQYFYTADGELYTVQKRKHLWAITREPQNLVLENIDEAYKQLTKQGDYFPDAESAQGSLDHEDTVVIDPNGLALVRDDEQYGHFVVNPRTVRGLSSEQRMAAQRIYGPDENNFGLNMEMFAEAGIVPYIFVLLPDYVQGTLRGNDKEFLGRASWLKSFYYLSDFYANGRGVGSRGVLRGVRHELVAAGDAPKNEVPSAPREITPEKPVVVTLERMLALSRPYVTSSSWDSWEQTLRKEYKQ